MKTILIGIWLYFSDFVWETRDAIMGSLVYSVYAHVFQNKPILKNIASFFIGVIFSIYFTDPICTKYTFLKPEFVAFVSGLMGMKLVEIVMDTNWKLFINNILESYSKTKIKENDTNSNRISESGK